MNKTFKILEILWLIMGGVGVIMCSISIINKDNTGSVYFLVFTIVCGLMYAFRKRQRIKFEAAQQQNPSTDNKK
jgi:uncharacterized membrane protein YfcA